MPAGVGNVLLAAGGPDHTAFVVKLCDFGLARRWRARSDDSASYQPKTTAGWGSCRYMSPEQFDEDPHAPTRSM